MTESTQPMRVPGFRFAGVACGLKPQTAAYSGRSLDLALIASERPCHAAGVFTQNQFPAAPVIYDKGVLQANAGGIQAVVINSGNANACTGAQGEADARRMAKLAEKALGLGPGAGLVLSTGVIGLPLPLDKIARGVNEAAAGLAEQNVAVAAQAIMTTDTRPKIAAASAGRASLLGIAKGAAMIHPNMATMLATVLTDAAVEPDALHGMLRRAVDRSFNAISVDGDQSTNDTVLALVNGLAGPVDEAKFEVALTAVCQSLARQIVRDAEGGSKFITVRVTGAASEPDARQVARMISTSVLVKTAVYGGDPNWGRVLMAAGNSGVRLDPAACALWFAGESGESLQVVAGGSPLPYEEAEAARIFEGSDLLIHLDLGQGQAESEVWTSDLTHEYVTLNAHYRT